MNENHSAYGPDEDAKALAYAEDTTVKGDDGKFDERSANDVEDFCCIYILCSLCQRGIGGKEAGKKRNLYRGGTGRSERVLRS